MGATIIVDAFGGDGGKGKFCAFLSKRLDAKLSVRAGAGTNAGHSFFIDKEFIKTRMLPLGCVNPNTKALISSGVAINPTIFLEEINNYDLADRAFVDRNCPVIESKHISYEKKDPTMIKIDSTKNGSGRARADYVMRRAKRAQDIKDLEGFFTFQLNLIFW
ncbi:MAG: adenylosuccinate synthetase [Desulfobacterales bacterium]|uniref:Adenylosuccinate synthetase n=1 Tax=Candidatus Desulfaltia bathyphila TaxID=2841697 RepID=A0A8J6N4I7_9BACT|nr:adenylosuccinate synthetase [Candidatus Desulfaltia bathyphila]MBL7195221.1 adenylosuccinate synthetase [Desulfobacterales bacterium]MBL7207442.1 adenylosuccinate synthetase [Desulfobacterales bacterium]